MDHDAWFTMIEALNRTAAPERAIQKTGFKGHCRMGDRGIKRE